MCEIDTNTTRLSKRVIYVIFIFELNELTRNPSI